jgi:predicted RNA-binding protein
MPIYWLQVMTKENFNISRKMDFLVGGCSKRWRKLAERIEPGDKILVYILWEKKFAAILEATSRMYIGSRRIWDKPDDIFPCRFERSPEVVLPEHNMLDLATARKLVSNRVLNFRRGLSELSSEIFQPIASEMRKIGESKNVKNQ